MTIQAGVVAADAATAAGFLGHIERLLDKSGHRPERRMTSGPLLMLVSYAGHSSPWASSLPYLASNGSVLTWEGRLDNSRELRVALGISQALDVTDTEVLSVAYEQWGENCFARLKGDWAICLWDAHRRRLLLARDYIGVRQLFYSESAERFAWCTNLDVLTLLSSARLHLDEHYIIDFILSSPRGDASPYREIRSVPPGSVITFERGQVTVKRYWNLPCTPILYSTYAEYEAHFRLLFQDAIARRLDNHTCVVAELSGGVDSSCIVTTADYLIQEGVSGRPRLVTLTYRGRTDGNNDDLHYVSFIERRRRAAGIHLPIGLGLGPLNSSDFRAAPGAVRGQDDQETAISSALTSVDATVILSGLGGDEVVGGVPDPVPQLSDLMCRFLLSDFWKELLLWSQVKRIPIGHLCFQAIKLAFGISPATAIPDWINPGLSSHFRAQQRLTFALPRHRPRGLTNVMAEEWARTYWRLAGQLTHRLPLAKGYRLFSYPFLDQDLMEFCISIPPQLLLRPRRRRALLRGALRGIVPDEILERQTKPIVRETAISSLVNSWSQLAPKLNQLATVEYGLIEQPEFQLAIQAMLHGKGPLIYILRALSVEWWLKELQTRNII